MPSDAYKLSRRTKQENVGPKWRVYWETGDVPIVAEDRETAGVIVERELGVSVVNVERFEEGSRNLP